MPQILSHFHFFFVTAGINVCIGLICVKRKTFFGTVRNSSTKGNQQAALAALKSVPCAHYPFPVPKNVCNWNKKHCFNPIFFPFFFSPFFFFLEPILSVCKRESYFLVAWLDWGWTLQLAGLSVTGGGLSPVLVISWHAWQDGDSSPRQVH